MAVPGFSVTDLIQALGQVKLVYDAFFNEYTNSASQVRDLADHIEQFRKNLQDHKEIAEEGGLQYTGYEAVQRTLESCYRFLDEYKEVLDKGRKKSVVATLNKGYKTARFAFEQSEITRLQAEISRHQSNILHYSMNHVLKNSLRRSYTSSPNAVATAVPIPGESPHSVSPPSTPPLLGSPLLTQDHFQPQSPRIQTGSVPTQSPVPPALKNPQPAQNLSPQLLPATQSPTVESPTTIHSPSLIGSPALQSIPKTSQSGLSIPGLVLPQPALPYIVAEVYFENNKVELKRKAAGRDCSSGREMVILDAAGNLRYRHRIKRSRNDPCFPYTWHKRWQKDHNAFEIDFKGTAPEAHSISFKGAPAISAIPKYIFSERKDFEDFQSELRGKHLEATFEVSQIICASSSKNGEATDQHLKIWRDHSSQECFISFYASAIPKPRHMEFPLAIFDQQISSKGDVEISLNFIGHGEPKRARTLSKAFSRSPTERSTSSASTTVPGVFTRNNTGIASSASSVTTANSRMSVVSYQSDNSTSQTERCKTSDPLEICAKTMKYLRVEFSDEDEASRFKQTYARLYQEEISRPLEFFHNWQLNAAQQRPESVISTSPSGTPFTMSPVLHPIRNQEG